MDRPDFAALGVCRHRRHRRPLAARALHRPVPHLGGRGDAAVEHPRSRFRRFDASPRVFPGRSALVLVAGKGRARAALGPAGMVGPLAPLLAGLVALLLFWRMCRTALSPTAASLAVGIMAVSYYPIRHASEVKPYAFDLCCAVVLAWLTVEHLRSPAQKRWLATLCAVTPLAVFSSYPSVFVGGGIDLVLLATMPLRPWPQRCLFVLYNVLLGLVSRPLRLGGTRRGRHRRISEDAGVFAHVLEGRVSTRASRTMAALALAGVHRQHARLSPRRPARRQHAHVSFGAGRLARSLAARTAIAPGGVLVAVRLQLDRGGARQISVRRRPHYAASRPVHLHPDGAGGGGRTPPTFAQSALSACTWHSACY